MKKNKSYYDLGLPKEVLFEAFLFFGIIVVML